MVYHSDWEAEQFARRVDDAISAVTELGWSTTGTGGAAATSMNLLPERLRVRKVHILDPSTGEKLSLPIATNDAGVYSVTTPTLTYKTITFDIVGFSGERRTLPH